MSRKLGRESPGVVLLELELQKLKPRDACSPMSTSRVTKHEIACAPCPLCGDIDDKHARASLVDWSTLEHVVLLAKGPGRDQGSGVQVPARDRVARLARDHMSTTGQDSEQVGWQASPKMERRRLLKARVCALSEVRVQSRCADDGLPQLVVRERRERPHRWHRQWARPKHSSCVQKPCGRRVAVIT